MFGAGGVGLNAIQAAALSGARKVIAIDLQPGKLELARTFGATHTVNPNDGDTVEQVRTLTDAATWPTHSCILKHATQIVDHGGPSRWSGWNVRARSSRSTWTR